MTNLYTDEVYINRLLSGIIFMSLLGSFSCGLKGPTTPASEVGSFSLQELQCKNADKVVETESYKKIINRAEEIDSFLNLYNKQKDTSDERIYRPILGQATQSTSPVEPMIMGEKANIEELQELQQSWIKAIGDGNWFHFLSNKEKDFQLLEDVNTNEMKLVLRKFNRLLEKASRWNYNQCNLVELRSREKKDVRSYLAFLDFTSESCNQAPCNQEELSKAKEVLISLCTSFNSAILCEMEYRQHAKQSSLSAFRDYYLEQSKKNYEKFFKIDVINKWTCSRKLEKTIIEVPYYVDDKFEQKIGGEFDRFEAFVERKWGEGEIQLKLIRVKGPSDNVVTLEWNSSSVSFVQYARAMVINMSEQLSYKKLMLVYAHELGHVLGFPDCYLEFYESSTEQTIYYDLDFDQDNLMCDTHFGAKAPESYLQQIVDKACKD